MDKYEELFWKLFNANGEEEVFDIIKENELLKNPDNWKPYGGDDSNFSVFDNQQPNAVPALIEKITNSIDSILIKECKLRNIDPKNKKDAPQSMSKAVEEFFQITSGELIEMTPTERKKLSENIQLIATGNEKTPDILIFDNGEGQHPDDFPDTFLSIRKGNKNKIHFVQGQFNMGSTGAVVFCGEHRYQIIASRKNQKIFEKEAKNRSNPIGFTLVRRHILNEQEDKECRNSWYEYFILQGKIPSFEINNIDIRLCNGITFESGAIIKLFSYNLPRGCRGTIRDGLFHELNQSLYKPALPFLLSDKREKYYEEGNNFDLPIFGNDIRLNDDKDIIEIDPVYEQIRDKEIGEMKIKAILLKKGKDKQHQDNRKRRFIGRKAVIFTINGQVHGFYGNTKIKEWGFPYLKESLLIHIDCTNMKTNFRQDLFMADRYNFKESKKLDKLIDKIKDILKHSKLRELNEKKKEQLLSGNNNENDMNIIKHMLYKNPISKELKNLLKNSGLFINKNDKKRNLKENPPKKKNEHSLKKLKSKRFPSIFRINLEEKNGKCVKSIPLEGKGIVQFETDVQNDYFQRPHDSGELILEVLGYNSNSPEHPGGSKPSPSKIDDIFNTRISGPDDHSIKITIEPRKEINVGDEVKVNARLSSPDGEKEVLFYVRITEKKDPDIQKESEKNNPNNETLDLPKLIKISKRNNNWIQGNDKAWNEDDWNDNSVIHIKTSEGKIDAIAINIDNHLFKRYISKQKPKDEKHLKAIQDKSIAQVYLHGLFLFYAIQEKQNNQKSRNTDLDSEKLVSNIFEIYGEALLYLDTNEEILKYVA